MGCGMHPYRRVPGRAPKPCGPGLHASKRRFLTWKGRSSERKRLIRPRGGVAMGPERQEEGMLSMEEYGSPPPQMARWGPHPQGILPTHARTASSAALIRGGKL